MKGGGSGLMPVWQQACDGRYYTDYTGRGGGGGVGTGLMYETERCGLGIVDHKLYKLYINTKYL